MPINLSDLIKQAKGYDRTMAEFANLCGVSPVLCSRIAAGKNVRITEETLRTFYANQAAEANISWDDWMLAGQALGVKRGLSWQDAITNYLVNRGIALQKENLIAYGNEYIDTQLAIKRDLIINLVAERKHWSFIAPRGGFIMAGKNKERVTIGAFHCERVFLQDAWFPKTLSKEKTTFVFTNGKAMEVFIEEFGQGKYKNDFSIIFVNSDTSNNIKIEEYQMNGEDYPNSIFSQGSL